MQEFCHRFDGLVIQSLHGFESEFQPLLYAALQFGDEKRIQTDLKEGCAGRQIFKGQPLGRLPYRVLDLGDQPLRE